MRLRLFALLCLLTLTCRAVEPERFLRCVTQVEGANWTIAPGGYGLTKAVWREYSTLPYHYARYPTYAHEVALRHLARLERRLRARGYDPTPELLGSCWRYGMRGGLSRPHCDYGRRVSNLYGRP